MKKDFGDYLGTIALMGLSAFAVYTARDIFRDKPRYFGRKTVELIIKKENNLEEKLKQETPHIFLENVYK